MRASHGVRAWRVLMSCLWDVCVNYDWVSPSIRIRNHVALNISSELGLWGVAVSIVVAEITAMSGWQASWSHHCCRPWEECWCWHVQSFFTTAHSHSRVALIVCSDVRSQSHIHEYCQAWRACHCDLYNLRNHQLVWPRTLHKFGLVCQKNPVPSSAIRSHLGVANVRTYFNIYGTPVHFCGYQCGYGLNKCPMIHPRNNNWKHSPDMAFLWSGWCTSMTGMPLAYKGNQM